LRHYYLHRSRKAVWSQRIALLFFVLFAVAFGLHRVGQLPTPLAMNLFGITIVGAVIAMLLSIVALANIWREGYTGAGAALSGMFLGALILAGPVWLMPSILTLPRIHEVSTDLESPPRFDKVVALRKGAGVNPPEFQRSGVPLQLEAYPDLKPLSLNRPKEDTYSAVRDAVKNLRWRIVSESLPSDGDGDGIIEATHRSLIFGFTDDMVIRVTGIGNNTRVDIRSSARNGDHDLGRNADRVRALFSEVKTRLSEADKAEAMKQAIAIREIRMKKAMEEKEKKRILAEREEARQKARQAALSRESQISNSANGDQALNPAFPPGVSPPAASGAQAQSTRQRQQVRTRSLRRFWEELNR
jgi:uncharacterized protein (DUF1499 family)